MMRESVRFTRLQTGFAALAALFVFGADASAQDTRSFVERQGFREYQDTGEDRPIRAITPNPSFTVDTNAPILNIGEISQLTNRSRGESVTDDEIVVTAERQENFAVTPHPDFVADPFERAGITTNLNPENEGLELFPIRRDDIEGWRGVDVDLLNTGRFSIEAQVKRGAGLEFTYHFGRD